MQSLLHVYQMEDLDSDDEGDDLKRILKRKLGQRYALLIIGPILISLGFLTAGLVLVINDSNTVCVNKLYLS